jgi:antitoxin (DNA-binding transcriptional repressor) of toxin-antitoxin stability system
VAFVKTISQRELRNDNAKIIRGIERGESYTVTRHGIAVAQLSPVKADSGLRCIRPARKQHDFSALGRVVVETPGADVLDDLRGER